MNLIKFVQLHKHVELTSRALIGLLFSLAMMSTNILASPSAEYKLTKTDLEAGLIIEVVAEHGTATQPVPLNKLTKLTVTFTGKQKKPLAEISELTFDARMPDHNHGMVVKPQVANQSEGIYVVQGVKLHMPGKWELIFDFRLNGKSVKQIIPYELKVH